MQYHFKNLVFEGGGVKGIAYIGAMKKKLEDSGRKGAEDYLKWFDKKNSAPENRP